MYAPEELACTQYLKEITCTVSEKSQLKQKLSELLEDDAMRAKYILNGLETVEKNHRMDKNCDRFQKILLCAAEKKA